MFNKRNTRIKCEQYLRFTIMTTEPHQLIPFYYLNCWLLTYEDNFVFILLADFEKVNIGYLGS